MECAVRSQLRPATGSPGPGTSGEKRAWARAPWPCLRTTGTVRMPRRTAGTTFVGSGCFRRLRSWNRGSPETRQAGPETSRTFSWYEMLPAPALPMMTTKLPASCEPVHGGTGADELPAESANAATAPAVSIRPSRVAIESL